MPSFFPDAPRTAGASNWRLRLSAWLPALLGIAVICIESTGTFSAQNTSSWLRPVFERIFGPFRDANWELFHHLLRKSGHFLGYGSLGLAFLRAWLCTLGPNRSLQSWRLRATALAIASTALIACGDEFHQAFLPARTGVPTDVVLDTCGACALCLLVWLVRFRPAPRGLEPLPSDV
jgi:VanZ family protein